MPKYMIQGSYSIEGIKGLLKDGGSGRRAAVEQLVGGMGGSLESFYYMLGSDDVVAIADLPDDETAAAIAMAVGASGAVGIRTTKLLTTDQVDAAASKTVEYRPPGG